MGTAPTYHRPRMERPTEWLIPVLIGAVGLITPFAFLEWALRQPWCERYLVSYNDKGVRWEPGSLPAIGDRVKDALVKTAILAVLSGCILERVSPVRISDFDLARLPAMPEALGDLVMLILLVDFMQYVIHWCFHKSDFLWKHVHSLHHREHTCTPLSTIRATLLDAFITHPVPLITAKFVLQPHPLIYFGAVFFILWDVVYVHSGIDAPWLNAMALEFLPF